MNECYVGTSGWHYGHWKRRFYPDEVKPQTFLDYYSKFFNSVEINNTFYQLPKVNNIKRWYETVPADFIFSVKASGLITHRKRLINAEETLKVFLNVVEGFKEKLGPILFLLPPAFEINLERLESFLKILPSSFQYTFELRNPSWWIEETFDLLSNYNCALCLHDFDHLQPPLVFTSNKLTYFRLHGPEKPYKGLYPEEEMKALAGLMKNQIDSLEKVFCFFDNDENAYAVKNALYLRDQIFSGNF